jgi:hypothetical protein
MERCMADLPCPHACLYVRCAHAMLAWRMCMHVSHAYIWDMSRAGADCLYIYDHIVVCAYINVNKQIERVHPACIYHARGQPSETLLIRELTGAQGNSLHEISRLQSRAMNVNKAMLSERT